MLEPILSPDTVLAYRAVRKIEASDYESILQPAVGLPPVLWSRVTGF
jgi:hypothetical protein